MMLPALLLLAAISLFPFVYLIWMSLNNVSLAGGLTFRFVGLDNWIKLFSDPQVGQSWMVSLVMGAHGEEPEPSLHERGRSARLHLRAFNEDGQGNLC
jgi:hypothetical protein